MRRVSVLLVLAIVVAFVGACSTDPRGTRLGLQTAPVQADPGGCDGALAAPFRISRVGTEMAFIDAGTGAPRPIIWPFGFAAWLEFGVGVLYASDGNVVAREGDVLDNIGGSEAADGFRVCSVGVRTYH